MGREGGWGDYGQDWQIYTDCINSRNCQRTTYSSVGGLLLSVDGVGTPLFDLSGLSLSIRLSDRSALRTKSSEAIGFR